MRVTLDRYAESPSDPPTAAPLDRASQKKWIKVAVAVAAGLASDESAAAARAGHEIELRARAQVTDGKSAPAA